MLKSFCGTFANTFWYFAYNQFSSQPWRRPYLPRYCSL